MGSFVRDALLSFLGAGIRSGGSQEIGGEERQDNSCFAFAAGNCRAEWKEAQLVEEVVHGLLSQIIRPLDKMFAAMKEELDDPAIAALVTDLSGTVKDLTRARDELRLFMKADKPRLSIGLKPTAIRVRSRFICTRFLLM